MQQEDATALIGETRSATPCFPVSRGTARRGRNPPKAEDDIVIPGRALGEKMIPSNTFSERQPSHKASLYCTSCNHASRINGDWIINVHTDHLDYECPECGTTIDSRRDGEALTTQSGGLLQPDSAD